NLRWYYSRDIRLIPTTVSCAAVLLRRFLQANKLYDLLVFNSLIVNVRFTMKNIRLAPLFLAMISASAFSATEELIVTGSYNPVTNEQLSSSVSVINKDELLRLSSTNVIDALRQIPSLWVEEQGGPGGVT